MSKIASDLVDWYWKFGAQRTGAHRIIASWLIKAYESRMRERSLELKSDRVSVAVWGPSAVGKSTLLSNYIDHKTEPRSALMWNNEPFVFSETEKARERMSGRLFGWAFNPFNGGNDASACVTRFYGANRIDHEAFPARLYFADRQQILHALACGYISECKLDIPPRAWSIDDLRKLLPQQDTKVKRDQNACELLMEAIYVVDRMIVEQNGRYISLKASISSEDNEWEHRLKDEILGNGILASDWQQALNFVATLLWDSRTTLTTFFGELTLAREYIDTTFGSEPIYCSLVAASLFLDMDTEKRLQNIGKPNPGKKAYVDETVKKLKYVDQNGHVLIGTADVDLELLSERFTFGHLQALIWEISIPLNNEFLEQNAPDVAAFISKADILDIPGVANEQRGAEESLLDLEKAAKSDLFLKVLKRGKTASIINRFAEEGRIDEIVLLVRSDDFPSKPDQLSTGIKMIWKELDPDYEVASKKPPPAPITLNLTFFNKEIDMIAETGASAELSAIATRLAGLGAIIDPEVCRTFVTSYPQFIEGRLAHDIEGLRSVPSYLEKSDWVASRFRSRIERGSIDEMLSKGHIGGDGAVTFFLKELGRALDLDAHSKRTLLRRQRQAADMLRLVSAVAPAQSQNAERARELIRNMITTLETELRTLPATRPGKERLTALSVALRQSFSFTPDELRPLPKSRDDLVSYVDDQINLWIENEERSRAMANLGIPQIDRLALLEAVSRIIDREAITKSLATILSSMPNADRNLLAHATRFVATLFNNQLRGGQSYFEKQPSNLSHADFVKYCNDYFPKWINPRGNASDTPHFQMIVLPMMGRLGELSQQIGAGDRKELVGDPYVAEMLRTLEPAAQETASAPDKG